MPKNYEFGIIEIQSPSGNPIRVYDLERALCDILRGSGSDIQIVGEAMKRYAASKTKDIQKLMQYAEQLRVKPKVLHYMEVLLWLQRIHSIFQEICAIEIEDDVQFEIAGVSDIREGDDYPGIRVAMKANYPPISVPLTVDVTTGDMITPVK